MTSVNCKLNGVLVSSFPRVAGNFDWRNLAIRSDQVDRSEMRCRINKSLTYSDVEADSVPTKRICTDRTSFLHCLPIDLSVYLYSCFLTSSSNKWVRKAWKPQSPNDHHHNHQNLWLYHAKVLIIIWEKVGLNWICWASSVSTSSNGGLRL